jgi:hypothetical protein
MSVNTTNLIINGNFDLWQRGTTFTIPYNAKYSNVGASGTTYTAQTEKTADRWYAIDTQKRTGGSTGSVSIYKELFSTSDEQSSRSKYYITIANNITSITGGYCYLENKQENSTKFNNTSLTLSFAAKYSAGVTGTTLGCYYRQAINPNTTEYRNMFEIVELNEYWSNYSITFVPPFVSNSGISGDDYFGIGFVVMPNSTVSVSSVSLQTGNYIPPLNTNPEEEKARQSKYYYRSYSVEDTTGSVTTIGGNDLTAIDFTVSPNYTYNYHFDSPMRKSPSITLYSPSSGVSGDGYNRTASKDMRLTSGTRGWNQVTRFSPTGAATLTTSGTTYGVAFNVATGAVVFDDILVHMVADADLDYSPYDKGLET